MNTEYTSDDGSIGRPNNTTEGYEWTCPYCGKSQLNKSTGENGEKNAIAALRTHIFASDGSEHGPRNKIPTDETLVLSEHVVEVDRGH